MINRLYKQYNVDLDVFSRRLRSCINDNDLSFADFDTYDVCSGLTVSKYLSGKYYPNVKTLLKICSFLGVSMDWILGLSEYKDLPTRWVWINGECRCSNCLSPGQTTFRYCPSCGDRMQTLEL